MTNDQRAHFGLGATVASLFIAALLALTEQLSPHAIAAAGYASVWAVFTLVSGWHAAKKSTTEELREKVQKLEAELDARQERISEAAAKFNRKLYVIAEDFVEEVDPTEAPLSKLSVARDFSRFPVGRTRADGPNSGEHLRALIIERLRHGPLEVDLDGTMGYSSSFLEAAFAGLSASPITFVSNQDPSLVKEVRGYMEKYDRLGAS